MAHINLRMLPVAAAVLLSTASIAQSQKPTPSDSLLASEQLRELVAAANTPAEYRQVRDHFAALADQDDAQGRRYTAFADAYQRSPYRHEGDFGAHYTRLAELSQESSKAARDLITYYERLAGIVPSGDRTSFDGNALGPDKQLLDLIATAHTSSDHTQLRQYFSALAAAYKTDADTHAAVARSFKTKAKRPATAADDPAAHCERLAQLERTASETAQTLATEHQKLVPLRGSGAVGDQPARHKRP